MRSRIQRTAMTLGCRATCSRSSRRTDGKNVPLLHGRDSLTPFLIGVGANIHRRIFSSLVSVAADEETSVEEGPRYPCGSLQHENDFDHLPPPLPEPSYSVYKRVLPSTLIAMSSLEGRNLLLESLTERTAESYWVLIEQFINQSDPAFCGVTTLVMVLNSMGVDPNVRWRGGWRFFGSEDVILNNCCLSAERIRRAGVTMEEFALLSRCQGLQVELKRPIDLNHKHAHSNDDTDVVHHPQRPAECQSLQTFRDDVLRILTMKESRSILVTSFSRSALGQTGDGHFSPIAAYHKGTDQVLILDVARFKYAPYWAKVEDLYQAMQPYDSATKRSRGWFLLHPPINLSLPKQPKEVRRPAELVPLAGEPDVCPLGRVKVQYCSANNDNNKGKQAGSRFGSKIDK